MFKSFVTCCLQICLRGRVTPRDTSLCWLQMRIPLLRRVLMLATQSKMLRQRLKIYIGSWWVPLRLYRLR